MRSFRYRVLSALALVLASMAAYGQHPGWKQFSNTEAITAMADAGDHLWLGTQGGLIRFNKETGEKILFTNANSKLPDNYIRSLAIDTRGDLWVSTRLGGLSRFDGTTWTRYDTTNSPLPTPGYILAVRADTSGNVWAVVAELGVARFDGTSWKVYTKAETGFPVDRIFNIAIASDGTLWGLMFDKLGVAYFDGNTWVRHELARNGLPFDDPVSISALPNGDVWVGTDKQTAVRFDGTTWQSHILDEFLDSNVIVFYNPVSFVLQDADGSLLAASSSGIGLLRYREGEWSRVQLDDSLRKIWLVSGAFDGAGELWIATSAGLLRYDGASWRRYSTVSSGIPTNHVGSILVDRSGNIWVGSSWPLARYDGSTWTSFGAADGFVNPGAYHLTLDSGGNVWCLGAEKRLHRYDGKRWTAYDTSEYKLYLGQSIAVDSSGRVWIAGYGGISRYENGAFTKLDLPLPPQFQTTALMFDAEDRLWVADPFKGLAMLDGSSWKLYTAANGLPSNKLSGLSLERETGAIWVASGDAGVARYDGTSWTTFNVANGALPSNLVSAITIGGDRSVWVGTYAGLARYGGGVWTTYTVANSGLPDDNILELFVASDNTLLVGTTYGGMATYKEGASGVTQRAGEGMGNEMVRVAPNPATGSATVRVESRSRARIRVSVIDALGQEVARVVDAVHEGGSHMVPIEIGSLPAGTYYVRAVVGDAVATASLVVVR